MSVKIKLKYLTTCTLLSVALIIILFKIADAKNHRDNHFTRLFPPHFLSNGKSLDLKYNSFYLAGLTTSGIFLGNITGPGYLIRTDYELQDSTHFILKVDPKIHMAEGAVKVYVDSPDIYMADGLSPLILKGNFNSLELHKTPFNSSSFDEFAIISNHSFASRIYNSRPQTIILTKSTYNPSFSQLHPDLLKKRGDGIFSPDGLLVQDKKSKKIAYVYFYRNEFIYLDTNLNLILTGHTIDTIHTPQIKLSRIFSENKITFSSPPLTVNKTSCVDSNLLFINSKLKATNEFEDSFSENSVIDIYTLTNGQYLYSFYIPDDNNVKMRSFQVYNHKLIAFFDHTMMTFSVQY